jgi:hypothetical protein
MDDELILTIECETPPPPDEFWATPAGAVFRFRGRLDARDEKGPNRAKDRRHIRSRGWTGT